MLRSVSICTLLFALNAILANPLKAQDFKDRLPRIPPVAPADALATFQVEPGFRLEQTVAEPLLVDPVALSFDENGRLYVIEMRDYSEDDTANLGRVRLLEDADGDGKFEKSSVFVEGLSWPTAILCCRGGVVVGAPPDIWFFKDTDGDGKADQRQKLFSGFGRSNVQGLMNSFRWGLDHRIHGAASSAGGDVSAEVANASPPPVKQRINGRDFSFNLAQPPLYDFRLESGGGQHGMCFDAAGRKFASSNSDHIQQVMFEDRYVARNPFLAAPGPRVSIAADGPAAEVYRTSPVEPWRIVRTELRVAGAVPGVVEGGGRPAGYFTGATAVTIYTGDMYPPEYRGNAFVGDVGSNLVHRKILKQTGIEQRAFRADKGREFLTSNDIWFRPVQFANAPDGCLWVLDMCREAIEHPKSIPPAIKQHLDLTSGRDRGRLYRVVPQNVTLRKPPRLGEASAAELVALLAHPNGWHRETAARLLFERQDRSTIAALEKQAASGTTPEGRMHSLYALAGLQALTSDTLLAACQDREPLVRLHAVKLSEGLLGEAPALAKQLLGMAEDENLDVRYQLAFTLGQLPGRPAVPTLARLLERDGEQRWMRLAVLSSSASRGGELLSQLLQPQTEQKRDAQFLATLAEQVGREAQPNQVAAVLDAVEKLPSDQQPLAGVAVRGLSQGLAKSKSPLRQQLMSAGGKAGAVLQTLITQSISAAQDSKRKEADRAAAVQNMALAPFAQALPVLTLALDSKQPHSVQLAAVDTLSKFDDPAVARLLMAQWSQYTPGVRTAAVEALFARPQRATALLEAVKAKQISATQLDPARLQVLAKSRQESVARLAAEVLQGMKLGRRTEVVEAHRDVLKTPGDVERGRLAFRKICAACHRLENHGFETGPNLAAMRNRGPETILLNVLDPNREVNPQYLNYVVITDDGRSLTGMVSSETATSITLRRAEGQTDTVLRANIDEFTSTGLSIMPEGVEKQLSKQDLADIIQYLMSIP